MLYKDLELTVAIPEPITITVGDKEIKVAQYLPMDKKMELISDILFLAVDPQTGIFSPMRTEVAFCVKMMDYYTDLEMPTDLTELAAAYDVLETNGIFYQVIGAIPQIEYDDLTQYLEDCIASATAYNTSFAGVLQAMSNDAGTLSTDMEKLMESIKNREGLELLSEIKNVAGKED